MHSISLGHYYGKRLCQHGASRALRRDFTCTSLAPTQMTVVFGLGSRLRVLMRTTFENGVLRNGQQPGSAVNTFTDSGTMKTLSGRIALRCDKHQFCDKMTVSTWTVFELSLFEQSGLNKERRRKMALLQPHTFAFNCLPRGFWYWPLLLDKLYLFAATLTGCYATPQIEKSLESRKMALKLEVISSV